MILQSMRGIKVREATTQQLEAFLRMVAAEHGPASAKSARSVLSGMFKLAVRFDARSNNPIREVSTFSAARPKQARAFTSDDLVSILNSARSSQVVLPAVRGAKKASELTVASYSQRVDLLDVLIMLAATGERISEVLGLRWSDIDLDQKLVSITGKIVRGKGLGLFRDDSTKTEAGTRVVSLPDFGVQMLHQRKITVLWNSLDLVFPSSTGTIRDADNTMKQWKRVREALGFEWASTHTFRKALATVADSAGISARQVADHLGHRQVSMTQDVYMGRGRTHPEVALALDAAVGAHLDQFVSGM